MAVDTFICGSCDVCFFTLEDFVTHKKECSKEPASVTATLSQPSEQAPPSVCDDVQQDSTQTGEGTVELVTINQEEGGVTNAPVDFEVVVTRVAPSQTHNSQSSGRRRGRPKKSEVKKRNEEARVVKQEKPLLPEKSDDGRYHCSRCKLSFTRERTFHAHKCLAGSDYVDVTKKEVVSDADSHDEEDEDRDDDEFSHVQRGATRKRRKLRHVNRSGIPGDVAVEGTLGAGDGGQVNTSQLTEAVSVMTESGDVTLVDAHGPKMPLFRTEQDRLEFEECINVDLSIVDDMYTVHMIEQNMNENGQADLPRSNQLSIFSCKTCDKVFKTLSHMRLHCLTHTHLKPFHCPKCPYTSNSKGNMYTHMKKHTGHFFMCKHCSFMTVNKTHLKEHEDTHNGLRHECQVCKKDYNTVKSLVNHVRKYHSRSKDGQAFLETLQPKTSRMNSLLYLCHVCNRKFKKKVDRDRHLFVHDIRDGTNVVKCDMCEYVASRRVYLLAHFKKHRIIYHCCLCSDKFLSTIRLQTHVLEQHELRYNIDGWDTLLAKCIEGSVYLPEHATEGDNTGLPVELTVGIKQGSGETEDQQGSQPSEEVPSPTEDVQAPTEGGEAPSGTGKEKGTTDDLYSALGYRQLTMKILETLREIFGNMECEFCGRLFGSKLDYEPHLRTHTGEKPFACELCSYRGNTKDNLKRHLEKEHDDRTYPCNQCNFVARNRTQLWAHNQKHDNTQCSVCSYKCASRKKLRLHLRVKHPELTSEDIDKMTGLTKSHVRGKIGKKTFKCPYCERTFLRSATDLQKHIWIHQDVKPFQCDVCSYACRSKNNLKSHMLRHSAHKPFSCQYCGKAYKSKTARRWHERSHKEGKMKCDKCPYEATQKSHLKRHMETHDIVKQYVCQHCDYSANTIGYMKIHYTRFHKGVQFSSANTKMKSTVMDTKVFKCLSCDYLFGNLSDMKRHLKIRHHIQVDDLHALDSLNIDNTNSAQLYVPTDNMATSQVQVVHVGDPSCSSSQEMDATAALQALHYSGGDQINLDEKTASAVNILQQIIDMSQQSTVVQGEEGGDEGLVAVNPEAIIVHDGDGAADQVVIQYINTDDDTVSPHVAITHDQDIIAMTTEHTTVE